MYQACALDLPDATRLLLNHGASVVQVYKEQTPLQVALGNKDSSCVKVMRGSQPAGGEGGRRVLATADGCCGVVAPPWLYADYVLPVCSVMSKGGLGGGGVVLGMGL